MASTLALRALLGTTLGLGALDLVWLDLAIAPQLVGAEPRVEPVRVASPAVVDQRALRQPPESQDVATDPHARDPEPHVTPDPHARDPQVPHALAPSTREPTAARAPETPEPAIAVKRVESVYFASLSVELAPAARDALAEIARSASSDIVVIGHTDHRGDVALNESLRLRRARVVRDHLALLGVSSDRVHVQTAKPAEPADEPEMWRDRRVDIHFATTASPPSARESIGASR